MKKTILRDKVVHILSRMHDGQKTGYCVCGKSIRLTSDKDLKAARGQVPTCKGCLSRHFDSLQTNHALKKQVDLYKDTSNVVLGMLSDLVSAQKGEIDKEAGRDSECLAYKEGSYPFIPNSAGRMLYEFQILKKFIEKEKRWSGHNCSPTKFLDAGCGIGNIMLLAHGLKMCNRTHGIEYFKETFNAAKQWLGEWRSHTDYHLFRADIMKFSKYKDYDIIYFYCPFSDERLQVRFEERLENHMKVGAILVPHLKKGAAIRKDDRFESLEIAGRSGDGWYSGPYAFIKVKGGRRKVSDIPKLRKDGRSSRDGRDRAKEKYKL